MFPTILIVDDEPSILQSLGGLLSDEGFEVLTASNGYEGLRMIEAASPDLVLLDIWMPGLDGIETLKEIKKTNPFIQVIIITGHGNIETAVKATKLGAFNLIEKPLSIDNVIVDINNALNFRRLAEENQYLRKKTLEKNAINGKSPAVLKLKQQIMGVAPTDSWVLIQGENGVGKELVARTIHQLSPRAEAPMIDVNCAAASEERLESALFGHEKGAFPGAESRKRGRMEIAGGGTLFLDEVADLDLATQAKLLRVLQERTFQRLGGSREIKVDIRVIAATNRDLTAEIEKGSFREDLYHRLNQVPVQVPSLRERADDIPELSGIFLKENARRRGGSPKRLSDDAAAMLCRYHWPGNVRELKNLLMRLDILSAGDMLDVSDIPAPYNPGVVERVNSCEDLFELEDRTEALKRFEAEFLRRRKSRKTGISD